MGGRPTRVIEPKWRRKHIMIDQAGEIAQHLSPDPFFMPDSANDDQRSIRKHALKICDGDKSKADKVINQLHRRTEALVLRNRKVIERVAIALRKSGCLTGEQVKGLIG
jgi:hypothetical protein